MNFAPLDAQHAEGALVSQRVADPGVEPGKSTETHRKNRDSAREQTFGQEVDVMTRLSVTPPSHDSANDLPPSPRPTASAFIDSC